MSVHSLDDETARAAARGDVNALRVLYDHFADRVYSVVRRVAGDDALAQDMAQETWIRVLRGLPNFRGEAQLGSWIHRIALNTALMGKQRERAQAVRDSDFAFAPQRPSSSSGFGERLAARLAVEQALDELPHGMRRVLVMHDIEGHSHDEIAAALSMTASTSRSQLGRARARLREVLERKVEV
jgi:RNA polymerase sigma-70 factor (ECF subfamily)